MLERKIPESVRKPDDKDLRHLLETVSCPGWEWLLSERPEEDVTKAGPRYVRLERTDGSEFLDLEYDPENPVNSFFETLAGFYDRVRREYRKNPSFRETLDTAREVYEAICGSAGRHDYPVPARRVTVRMELACTAEMEMQVTEAEFNEIRRNGCLPDHLYMEMRTYTERHGDTSDDYSVVDENGREIIGWK